MIGVIFLSGPSPEMHGLDSQRSPSLLPVGDRPALQHIIESLVTQGITRIELIVGHGPEQVETLLGNGDRWGCSFRYHLAAQLDYPYRSLKIISELATEPWVLVHAEQYPCVEFRADPDRKTIVYYGSFSNSPDTQADAPSVESSWGGTAVMPPGSLSDEMAGFTFAELQQHFKQSLHKGAATIVTTDEWLDVSTPAQLLQSQRKLLDKKLRGLLISGTERQPGVWVSRNATIHPSATLVPPLYIGTSSRIGKGVKLGPYAVVGADCIVDSNTAIDNSLIFEGSYVGEALEVHTSIVAHNLLVNVRLNASIDVSENFLIGRLDRPRRRTWIGLAFQSALALLLAIVFLPLSVLAWLCFFLARGLSLASSKMVQLPADEKPTVLQTYSLLGIGPDAWSVPRPAGWSAFLRQFLPGLFAVVSGNLSFVGLPPKTIAEIESLPEDWRAIYLRGKAGLITEAAITLTDVGDDMQLYLADAYYSAQYSWTHDLILAVKYFSRLFMPAHK